MRTEIENKLIAIVRAVAVDNEKHGARVSDDEELRRLYAFARLHQLEHFIAYSQMNAGERRFERPFYNSAGFTMRQLAAAEQLKAAFSRENIPFIILKGYVVRRLYREEWMRNSCDVDVLVRESDLSAAGAALEGLGYQRGDGLSAHDVTYNSGKIHLELHYLLMEEHRNAEVSKVLGEVWESATASEGSELLMSDEYYYFYHVAHIWKHLENGGCGIRPLLDLWMLNHRCEFDREARERLLLCGGMLKLEREMLRLAEYWFADGDGEGLETLEKYVLSGGAYGRTDNSVALGKSRKGGRVKYFLGRVFAPYSLLVRYYPVLKKHPYLLPIFEVKRWFDAMRRDRKKYIAEFKENVRADEETESIGEMLQMLGIDKKD